MAARALRAVPILVLVAVASYIAFPEFFRAVSAPSALLNGSKFFPEVSAPLALQSGSKQEIRVASWLNQTLPHAKLMLYLSSDGSGGMGSWRQELTLALLIAQKLEHTLVLRDWDHNVPTRTLHVAYDIPSMRADQLKALGHTFAWMHEVRALGIQVFGDDPVFGAGCAAVKLTTPFIFPRLQNETVADTLQWIKDMNLGTHGPLPWSYACTSLADLDGRQFWLLDTDCALHFECSAALRSFHLHPEITAKVEATKMQITGFLNGESYTCFHFNPAYFCDPLLGGHGEGEGATFAKEKLLSFGDCLHRCARRSLLDDKLPDGISIKNILVLSQSDKQLVPIVTEVLQNTSTRAFGLSDLGNTAPSFERHSIWGDVTYLQRAAVSWGLCTPANAESFIGSSWSGFSVGLSFEMRIRSHPTSYLMHNSNNLNVACN